MTDPKLDLVLERVVEVPPELVWRAWTTPELLVCWFCPLPWTTVDCSVDLHPGGRFYTVMRSPEGEEFPGTGCYLEVVPERRLVWTNALLPGFRPAPAAVREDFHFTASIELEPQGTGTRYRAEVRHGSAEDCARHAAMGFHEGWGKALDQLVALMQHDPGGPDEQRTVAAD